MSRRGDGLFGLLISSWFDGQVLRFEIGACGRQWIHALPVA